MIETARFGSATGRSRTLVRLAAFSVVFLCVGWSAYWYVAHMFAMNQLQLALAEQQREGRSWACETTTSGGYPFAIEIVCDGLTARVQAGGRNIEARARKALVRSPLYTPKLVTIDLSGPAEVRLAPSGARLMLDWRTLQISARGLPDRLDRLSIVADGAQISTDPVERPSVIAAFQFHIRRATGAGDSPYNLAFSMAGIGSAVLDTIIGSGDLAVCAGVGSVTQVDRATAGSVPERVDLWRTAGGRLSINLLSMKKGDFSAHAEGALGLDQSHRVDGNLDVSIRNGGTAAANLAKRADLGPLQFAAMLAGSLLSSGASNSETQVSLSFENGQLGVGPLKGLIALPPLY